MIDITTAAILLAFMTAFCLPFVLSHQKKKQHERLLFERFIQQANTLNLNINVYDLWRRTYMIGVDNDKCQLLYMKFLPEPQSVVVDLRTIKRITISKQEREIGAGKEIMRVIEKLNLVLDSRDIPASTSTLEFYDSDLNIGLSGESVLIQKWHDIIQVVLTPSPQKRSLVDKELAKY